MKAYRFAHLNVHSHYSIMDGCASIKELVDAAIKDKMPGIAITDNGNMFGIMEFSTMFLVLTMKDGRRRSQQTHCCNPLPLVPQQ